MNLRQRKKLSKMTAVTLLSVFTMSVSGFAQTVQTGNFEVVSSGTATPKTEVTIDVYYPGKTYTDLLGASEGDYNKILLYRDEVTADKNGKYEFKFNVSEIKTGEYTVLISKDGTDPIKETLVYSNPNDYKTAVDEINKAQSEEELKEIIERYSITLGIDLSKESDYSVDAILEIMLNSIKSEKADASDVNSVKNIYELSKVIIGLNTNKISNINDKIDLIDLDRAGVSGYYNNSYVSEDVQKNLTKRLSGKSYKSTNDLYKAFAEKFVLAIVETSGSTDAIKEVINAFSDKIGTSASGLTERNLSNISGKDFVDYSALKAAINDEKGSSKTSGGTGGGGGGKGGSISGAKTYPTESADTDNKDIELNYYVFDDLDSVEWARESICKLAEMNVLRGKEYRMFYPNDNITREEFVKMLALTYNLSADGASVKFSDVKTEDWFMPYVSAAYENGIVNGISEDLFGVGMNITRQDLAVMAYNAAVKSGLSFSDEENRTFSDDADISDYAKTAVYALRAKDVINGTDGKNFKPNDTATRAEAAKILYAIVLLSK